jgi:HlyD family secretion protein
VESRLVEGRTITAGDLLVRLDDTDPRLNKARAEAEADALGQERERLERELQVWRHHLRTAESDLARYQELKERGTVPPQRLEQAENAFREAQGRVAALEAGIGAIGKRITAARRELDLLVNQIDKTSISAPLDATILIKAVEPGEFVQPGQTVATLLDLRRAELKVFIPERDIAKVKLSALARVRVDAYPDRMFEARVARVDQAAQFTPRDIHMPEERVRLVFGVTLSLDNPDGVLKPGMPADAWILWQSAAGWPERLFVPE